MIGLNKRSALGLLVALLLSLLAGWPLLVGPGIINTRAGGDSPFLVVRLHQLVANLSAGVFPVRWMPEAAYGLGYPFFNYYAHLPYYFAAIFKLWGLGYIWAIRLTQIFGLLGAAAFMYLYLRRLALGVAAATLGAVAYTFAPFHLVNLYVRGDSLSEFYAFLFFPLILWSVERIKENPTWRQVALLALAYGGLIFTHNISALIFTPLLLLYILARAFLPGEKQSRYLLMSVGGLALGLVLSAFYWIPALIEGRAVQLAEATTGYFHYSNHFRDADIVQPTVIFDYSVVPGRNPFSMGLVPALATLAAGAFLVVRWLKDKVIGFPVAIHFAIFGTSSFLITSFSRPLWDQLPLLPFVQFPWRFLSVQALAASIIIALAIDRLRWPGLGSTTLGALLVGSSLLGLHPEYLDIGETDITPERLRLYEYFTTNIGSTVRAEYLPAGVETRPFTSPYMLSEENPLPVALEGNLLSSSLLWQRPDSQEWAVEVASPSARLAFPLYWFPGWQGYVDGARVETKPADGLGYLELDLSAGTHRLLLRLERTPLRFWSEVMSLGGILLVGSILLRGITIPWRKIGVLLVMVIGGGVLLNLVVTQARPSHSNLSDLSMDFLRVPYLHHNPQGINFADRVRLLSYEYSAREVWGRQEITITLNWDREAGRDLDAEVSLVTPAEQLFRANDEAAVSRLPIVEVSTRHQLTVSPRTIPGQYLVRVRVLGPDGELQPFDAQGESLGITYLEPVRIFNKRPASEDQAGLATFGDSIRLTEMRAGPITAARIKIDLEWMATQPLSRNYALSFRFLGANREVLFSQDLQPHYGFFPTSLWPAEESVFDSYLFGVPERVRGEKISAIELLVYRVQDLSPLGSYTLNLGL